MAETTDAGLKERETLYSDPQLRNSHRPDATRANRLERAGGVAGRFAHQKTALD